MKPSPQLSKILLDPEQTIDRVAEHAWKMDGSCAVATVHAKDTGSHVGSLLAIFLPAVDKERMKAHADWMLRRLNGYNEKPLEGQQPAAVVTADHVLGQASLSVLDGTQQMKINVIIRGAFGELLPTQIAPQNTPNRHARRAAARRTRRGLA
jgi:hypothetical protein